ncbi:MAG TPA: DPP IV N-terminal domain-containing protein [Gemmatimonadales bacterium]|nr:DPP IV N-terminal domain-containing protein [Gemmatimonadales bacterium]
MPREMLRGLTCATLAAAALGVPQARAQQPALTSEDYARAERYMSWNTAPLVLGADVRPAWLADGRFWYATRTARGLEYFVVDPATGKRTGAFDQAAIAAALSKAADTTITPFALPGAQIDSEAALRSASFLLGKQRFRCDMAAKTCAAENAPTRGRIPLESLSPDGKRAVFIRDWNLWLRDVASGQETQLTTDGVENFGYATDNAGWVHSDRPVVLWSPDSRKIATFQQDQRHVGDMYLVETHVGHPVLQAWKYPLPGDSVIPMIHRVIIDLGQGAAGRTVTPKVVRLQMPPDAHRSTVCDHILCRGEFADVEWYPDGSRLAFVSSTRDHKQATLRVADAATGAVRDVLAETVPTQYESGFNRANWEVLPATNEVVWFSERTDWGNLYLYDLATGKLKRPITTGTGAVLQVLKVDPKTRQLWFTAAGREPGRDPYFRHLYRVGLDGKGLTLLTPENADHEVALSPDGKYIVDSWSRPDVPPTTVLREATGKGRQIAVLEKADISKLLATGWTPPVPFTVKARDGKTDLYGLMFLPTRFDSTRKYPIVNQIYPGPQTGSVGTRSFVASRGDTRALAELGFVVVQLDAMGTPMRSKSFHDAYYGNMGDNGLPDQVAGMQQLAERHRWIDLARAGIWGHSGGGYAAADAMFRYPDFFKVGISEAGNHDNRNYEDDWGERYQGLLVRNPDGTTNYDDQANQSVAQNLKGKLLIAYGTLDDNVPPDNSLLVIDALIKANKDVDVLPLPNRRHGFGGEPYMVRRRWDYFVRHLMGAEPPREYELRAARTTAAR